MSGKKILRSRRMPIQSFGRPLQFGACWNVSHQIINHNLSRNPGCFRRALPVWSFRSAVMQLWARGDVHSQPLPRALGQ
ncbi:hypothetical protein PC128_g21155 [Phytophthora cactorum]|nr:hypothetical protein PC120_g17017 [Phytophthora cactorum]KAG3160253.1 hypothetical protein PC128_g21155 [Phytophthora cactorum]